MPIGTSGRPGWPGRRGRRSPPAAARWLPARFLPRVRLTPGLAADGAVHHGEERGRDVHPRDPAQVGGGDEPGEVAHGSAAERDDTVVALQPRGCRGARASRPAVVQVLSASPPATSSTVVAMPALRSEATSRSVSGRHRPVREQRDAGRARRECSDHVIERSARTSMWYARSARLTRTAPSSAAITRDGHRTRRCRRRRCERARG